MKYADFFAKATGGNDPYPYQIRFAEETETPELLRAPTGAGKTEAIILGWLYRKFEHPDPAVRESEPTRLVYCLPMRTLVEQTAARARTWLRGLGWSDRVGLTILMGGEPREEWHLQPEKPRILIGTQDMLLSRALNRGYGLSPFMWPVECGLLNSDCLWAMDEPQLMGDALATAAQLAGLRKKLRAYGKTRSVWMSATVDPDWLDTPDHPAPAPDAVLELGDEDFKDERLSARRNAIKTVSEAKGVQGGAKYKGGVARLALENHKAGTLTLVILNTVERAQDVYAEIGKVIKTEKRKAERAAKKAKASQSSMFQSEGDVYPRVGLLHSRFRPQDRESIMRDSALSGAPLPDAGEILVATQVVEAGVDASARLLISEIAPWSSMIQRLGRCSRAGEFDAEGGGEFVWLNRATKAEAAPYELGDVENSAEIMRGFEGKSASPAALESQSGALGEVEYIHVLRRRDAIDVFDNSADLSGGYTDISRYVRSGDERSAFVFWRYFGEDSKSPQDQSPPRRDELVSIPIGDFKKYSDAKPRKGAKAARTLWVWNFVVGRWEKIGVGEVRPGMSVMLNAALGAYSKERGWDVKLWDAVNPVELESGERETVGECHESDPYSVGSSRAVTLADHSRRVESEAASILDAFGMDESDPETAEAVRTAALFHDVGKIHPAFQSMLRGGKEPSGEDKPLAKSDAGAGSRIEKERRQFRHEIGSAMAVLQNADNLAEGWQRDLAAYLAMSHHGKVRMRLQPLSRGKNEIPSASFLLGFDMKSPETLDAVSLGEGVECPETTVDVSAEARIGGALGEEGRSWQDRAMELLERRGPFALAFLEAITRAADHRASAKERRSE